MKDEMEAFVLAEKKASTWLDGTNRLDTITAVYK